MSTPEDKMVVLCQTLDGVAGQWHRIVKKHGHWDDVKDDLEPAKRIRGEVDELIEGIKTYGWSGNDNFLKFIEKPTQENYELYIKHSPADECVDILLRVFDLMAKKKVLIGPHLLAKIRYNLEQWAKGGQDEKRKED